MSIKQRPLHLDAPRIVVRHAIHVRRHRLGDELVVAARRKQDAQPPPDPAPSDRATARSRSARESPASDRAARASVALAAVVTIVQLSIVSALAPSR